MMDTLNVRLSLRHLKLMLEYLVLKSLIVKDETGHVMIFAEYCYHIFLIEFCFRNVENVERLRC